MLQELRRTLLYWMWPDDITKNVSKLGYLHAGKPEHDAYLLQSSVGLWIELLAHDILGSMLASMHWERADAEGGG